MKLCHTAQRREKRGCEFAGLRIERAGRKLHQRKLDDQGGASLLVVVYFVQDTSCGR